MKKIVLSLALVSLLAGAAFYQEEDKSILRTNDALSQKARGFFVAMSKGDTDFFESLFADDVTVEINNVTINGKKEYIERLKRITTVLFEEMTFERLHVHTNYFSPKAIAFDGKTYGEIRSESTIWSNTWTKNRATGRTTKKTSTVPMHLDFRWENGKVVKMLGYYDPSFMNQEIAALEASKQ